MIHNIYGLYSTKDGIIRYVGETTYSLEQRLAQHKCDSLTRKNKTHKCNWIRSVYKEGYEIKILQIDTATDENWEESEIFWINEYKEKNKLTNELPGGNSGGPGAKRKDYLSYSDARKYMIENNIKSLKEYKLFYKKMVKRGEHFLPASAQEYYKLRGEWVNSFHFFGKTGLTDKEKHENFLTYDEAKNLVNSLGIKSFSEYKRYIKESGNTSLPTHPERAYAKDWIDRYNFFGKDKVSLLSYNEAKSFSMEMGFKTAKEYFEYRKNNKESKLPQHPERDYEEWVDWGEFLGTGRKYGKNKNFK